MLFGMYVALGGPHRMPSTPTKQQGRNLQARGATQHQLSRASAPAYPIRQGSEVTDDADSVARLPVVTVQQTVLPTCG